MGKRHKINLYEWHTRDNLWKYEGQFKENSIFLPHQCHVILRIQLQIPAIPQCRYQQKRHDTDNEEHRQTMFLLIKEKTAEGNNGGSGKEQNEKDLYEKPRVGILQ